jgi:3-hydroxybutyrate dehydrogenase
MVKQQLNGKTAVITASTRSIGRAIADAYVAHGANVVVSGRDPAKGQRCLDEMGAGAQAIFVACDATKREEVEALVDTAIAHYGQLDILVLNAGGVGQTAGVMDMTDEEWQYELDLNLNHTFWGMRRALPHMVARGTGRVIAISSVEGKLGKPGIPGYVANKHAINGLVKSAAHEVGTTGVTVNAICPGIVLTDMFYESGPETIKVMGLPDLDALAALFAADSAIKRPNTVEEVAAAAVMLASDRAAGMTGCLFPVDGGSAQY